MRGYGRNPFDDDHEREMAQVVAHAAAVIREADAEVARLREEVQKIKDEHKSKIKVVLDERKLAIDELEKYKNNFAKGDSLESKYAKVVVALFAITNSISDESAKSIAQSMLKELGEDVKIKEKEKDR